MKYGVGIVEAGHQDIASHLDLRKGIDQEGAHGLIGCGWQCRYQEPVLLTANQHSPRLQGSASVDQGAALSNGDIGGTAMLQQSLFKCNGAKSPARMQEYHLVLFQMRSAQPGNLPVIDGWIDHHDDIGASQNLAYIPAGKCHPTKTGSLTLKINATLIIDDRNDFLKSVVQADFISQPAQMTGKGLPAVASPQDGKFNGHPAPFPDRGCASAFRYSSGLRWQYR